MKKVTKMQKSYKDGKKCWILVMFYNFFDFLLAATTYLDHCATDTNSSDSQLLLQQLAFL
jgi:predicted YcjX-like family ATPase